MGSQECHTDDGFWWASLPVSTRTVTGSLASCWALIWEVAIKLWKAKENRSLQFQVSCGRHSMQIYFGRKYMEYEIYFLASSLQMLPVVIWLVHLKKNNNKTNEKPKQKKKGWTKWKSPTKLVTTSLSTEYWQHNAVWPRNVCDHKGGSLHGNQAKQSTSVTFVMVGWGIAFKLKACFSPKRCPHFLEASCLSVSGVSVFEESEFYLNSCWQKARSSLPTT